MVNGSAIKAVRCYTASGPVETCDRCSQGIRYVALVVYADGTKQRYGLDCINKVLSGDNSLRRLFEKNRKLAAQYAHWIDVLKREPEAMPRGREYFGSGLYFIGDDKGEDIRANNRWIFHPLPDWDKNQAGDDYVQMMTPEAYRAKWMAAVAEAMAWLEKEGQRLEGFLARVLTKASKAVA